MAQFRRFASAFTRPFGGTRQSRTSNLSQGFLTPLSARVLVLGLQSSFPVHLLSRCRGFWSETLCEVFRKLMPVIFEVEFTKID